MVSNKLSQSEIKRNALISKIMELSKELDFFEEIEVIILFGSRAREDYNSKSDLDLAFLLKSEFFSKINMIEFRINLSNYFAELTGIETDIILLNSAKPLLKFQVLKYGKKIYMSDDFDYASYFSKSLKEYFDFNYFKKLHYQKMRERLSD
ncbi:nucleotidyltransferase domain-containing protein [Halanaerobium sp. Z-7514]|uniref:Nucleotidyltransferase domain-containing protein n=1 Tax=Halanaerobium polyolivorans TaxID=2886943 RepID=A0AAW4WZG6_9FIRM|nr:nucleotidyltransferase domain-containing protein [Halanaerobium polyolivorans]MCC3144979.1 nucleotidyltransferase domain-containing protein [Halanaerobium polyolivorans]